MHYQFDELWPQIEQNLQAMLRVKLGYHDGADVLSMVCVQVWEDSLDTKTAFESVEHAKARYLKLARYRAIDYCRRRVSMLSAMDRYNVRYDHERVSPAYEGENHDIEWVLSKCNVEELGCVEAMMRGLSMRETAAELNVSLATVSRRFAALVKRIGAEVRMLDEDGNDKQHEGDGNMATRKKTVDGATSPAAAVTAPAAPTTAFKVGEPAVTTSGREYPVYDKETGARVATISATADNKFRKVKVENDAVVDSKDLAARSVSFLQGLRGDGGKVPAATTAAETKNTPPKAAPRVKARDAKKAPTEADRDAIGRDFPASLTAWVKKVGKGTCLCGCGTEVKRKFGMGHDAKLKGMLGRYSTANAKAIAAELGWTDKIRWAS